MLVNPISVKSKSKVRLRILRVMRGVVGQKVTQEFLRLLENENLLCPATTSLLSTPLTETAISSPPLRDGTMRSGVSTSSPTASEG